MGERIGGEAVLSQDPFVFHRPDETAFWRLEDWQLQEAAAIAQVWEEIQSFSDGLDTLVGAVPLAMVGCPESVIALFFLTAAIHGFFQHANLQIRCGPLNWFFSMAELHRWHHSPVTAQANHNYGQNLIVWDIVFGTRYLPADREPPSEVGLDGLPRFPQTLLGQLASPFRWRAITADEPGDGLAVSP